MIITSTINKKQALSLAKKKTPAFQNKKVYDSLKDGNPGITRFHEVFHFNNLRSLLKL